MSKDLSTSGTKHDTGKPPMELLPWEALEGAAMVLAHGRQKYAAHNWRGGFEWGRLAGAALRHLFAWLGGQDKDPESGLSHIDHALCCLMFLSAHIKSQLGRDDRYSKPTDQPPQVISTSTEFAFTTSDSSSLFRLSNPLTTDGTRFLTDEERLFEEKLKARAAETAKQKRIKEGLE